MKCHGSEHKHVISDITMIGSIMHESDHAGILTNVCPGCFSTFSRNELDKHANCEKGMKEFFTSVGVVVRPSGDDEVTAWVVVNGRSEKCCKTTFRHYSWSRI